MKKGDVFRAHLRFFTPRDLMDDEGDRVGLIHTGDICVVVDESTFFFKLLTSGGVLGWFRKDQITDDSIDEQNVERGIELT